MASVMIQPEVSVWSEDDCAVRWGFEFEGRGQRRTVRWTQEWLSSDHNPVVFTGTASVGNGIDPVILVHSSIHFNDGHVIDAIRLRVIPEGDDPEAPTTVYGEASTDSFAWTC